MANLNNVVNVSVVPPGRSLSRTNMNIVTIMTSEAGVLSTENRTKAYGDLPSVANDFGSSSSMYEYAKILFAQSKNPTNSGGYLVAGYWRAYEEAVSATSGKLTGAVLNELSVVSTLQGIANGNFEVAVDGTVQSIAGLDFQTIGSMGDVVAMLATSIQGASISYKSGSLVITSDTTGALSSVGTFIDGSVAGAFVGDVLGMADGTGALSIAGEDDKLLQPETKEEALIACLKVEAFKGVVFIAKPADTEVIDLAIWAGANDVMFYDVFDSVDNLERAVSNPVWRVKLSGNMNYRMGYRVDGNRKMAIAVMARMHTVNFNNNNSAITLNLKELTGIIPEAYEQSVINKAGDVGLDLYTSFGDLPKLLVSGANGYADNVYNFIAIKSFVQIDLFNLLGSTGTKLAQTESSMNKILDTAERTLKVFQNANVIGAGTWNSPDTFGDVEVFRRNIETNGFYVYAQPLADQAQSDREQRKSPAISIAFKNAGAIHSIDVTIQYNL